MPGAVTTKRRTDLALPVYNYSLPSPDFPSDKNGATSKMYLRTMSKASFVSACLSGPEMARRHLLPRVVVAPILVGFADGGDTAFATHLQAAAF